MVAPVPQRSLKVDERVSLDYSDYTSVSGGWVSEARGMLGTLRMDIYGHGRRFAGERLIWLLVACFQP